MTPSIAARLAVDKTFSAAPLSVRGAYRLLLDHADRHGRIVAPGLDAVATVRAALHCAHDEAEEVLSACVRHRLVAPLGEGVELLVASQGTGMNGATLADLAKRLNADFSYRGLATPEARRAWLASEDGRRRIATLGLTTSEADTIAENAGRRGRRASVISNTDDMQNKYRGNTEQLQNSLRDRIETPSSKVFHAITETAPSNTESNTETRQTGAVEGSLPPPASPSLSPSEVLPSHTLPSPTSPKPTQLHPPPSTAPASADMGAHTTPAAPSAFVLTLDEPTTATDAARGKTKPLSGTDALPPAPGTAAARIVEAIASASMLSGIVAKPNTFAEAVSAADLGGIDVVAEIAKANLWLIANPKHAKKNGARFLNQWISSAAEKAQSKAMRASQFASHDAPPASVLLGFGAAEVLDVMAKHCGGAVRLTADSALTVRLDALLAEVSASWSRSHGNEAVTLRHWQAFAVWLKKGGASGTGGIAEWWGRDRDGNIVPGHDKPGLVYFTKEGRLAKHFDEAMEWWARYRKHRQAAMASATTVPAASSATAEHVIEPTTFPLTPVDPEEDKTRRADVRRLAAAARAQFSKRGPIDGPQHAKATDP